MFSRPKIFALSLVSTLSLFSLTGCGDAASEAKVNPATPVVETVQPASPDPDVLENMSGLIADAEILAEVGDWHTVRVLGEQMEGDWQDIKDDVKATNKTVYETVGTHLSGLTNALQETSPDKTRVVGHLDELKKTLSEVSQ